MKMYPKKFFDQQVSDLVGEAFVKISDNLTLKVNFNLDNNIKDCSLSSYVKFNARDTDFNINNFREKQSHWKYSCKIEYK